MPISITRGDKRIHLDALALKQPGAYKILVNQCGNRPPEMNVIQWRFSYIQAQIIKSAFLIGKYPDIFSFLKVFKIARLNAPPKHIQISSFQSKYGSIRSAEDLEYDAVQEGAEVSILYRQVFSEKEIVSA